MDGEVVISVNNLCKRYKIYDKTSDMLKEIIFKRNYSHEKSVLENVSFNINKGDVVGIIGRNGAGKSTLLKIIAGVLDKTSGDVLVKGKISAILELGTGFHPEYTGRENIIMGGMCMGMSRAEMIAKSESIIEFSELGEVIDQPFKTYSSGMQSRLTFATAVSVEPDIFIVDEALAAGDAFFVTKCLNRMKSICQSGSTVLFVSHSSDLIRRLCNKAIYLEAGRIVSYGEVNDITLQYELQILQEQSLLSNIKKCEHGYKGSDGKTEIKDIEVQNGNMEDCYAFYQHDLAFIYITITSKVKLQSPDILFKFTRADGIVVTSWMNVEPQYIELDDITIGETKFIFQINDIMLGDGQYYISCALFEHREGAETAYYADPVCIWNDCVSITVQRHGRPLSTLFDQAMVYVSTGGTNERH